MTRSAQSTVKQAVFVAACMFFWSQQSNAATITINAPDASGRTFVDLVGEILPDDDKAFQKTTNSAHEIAQVIVTLSGPGGNAFAAMKIGELIHTYGWATYVPSGALCASSCGTIWLAGTPRYIEGAPGVIIGFHAIYDKDTRGVSGAANAVLGSYLTRWGFNEQGIYCVTQKPPAEMGWLTGADRKGCGITWEILTPERYLPLVLPQIPTAQPSKEQHIYLNCGPVSITDSPDPVITIAVAVVWQNTGASPQVTLFDAWHFTANGKVYERSEQYLDRRFGSSKTAWSWEGVWTRDRTIYMIGQVTMAHGVLWLQGV